MPAVTFTVTGRLADFGDDPIVGTRVTATASPSIKVGDVAVHSNQPDSTVTDADGFFTLELVSLPGLWYLIRAGRTINPVRIAAYIPDVSDPTTGDEFNPGTTFDIHDLVDETPTPGYQGLYLNSIGGVTDHGALTGLDDDDHPQYALADGSRGDFATVAQGTLADTALQADDVTGFATTSALNAEAATREEQDELLDAALDAETGERQNADAALDTRVGALEAAPGPDLSGYATTAALSAEATTRGNADTALDARLDVLEAVDTSAYATDAELAAHAADTTAIHGIANTAALVVTTDPRLSDARTPTAHAHPITDITATGTPSSGTYLRGDASWAAIPGGGVTDHGALTGLGDDDHTQYALANGTRGSFAPPLGADDNYVTDTEKGQLHTHPAVIAQGATKAAARTAIDAASITDPPVSHGNSHHTGNTDALTPADIGAAPALGSDDNYVTDAEKAALHTHPAFIGQGTTAALARAAIGAGTSSLAVGTATTDAAPGAQTINAQTGTSYTAQASDVNKLVTLTNSGAIALSIPGGSVFSAGQRIDFIVMGAGMVTVAGSAGATVVGTPSLVSRAQYSAFSVIALSATSFVAVGDMA